MRVVFKNPELCHMSDIACGEAFRWNGMYFIRPCRTAVEKFHIGGINLENGQYVTNSIEAFVAPVKMEAREL